MAWILGVLVILLAIETVSIREKLDKIEATLSANDASPTLTGYDSNLYVDVRKMKEDIELLSSNQKTIAYQLKQKLGYWIDL